MEEKRMSGWRGWEKTLEGREWRRRDKERIGWRREGGEWWRRAKERIEGGRRR